MPISEARRAWIDRASGLECADSRDPAGPMFRRGIDGGGRRGRRSNVRRRGGQRPVFTVAIDGLATSGARSPGDRSSEQRIGRRACPQVCAPAGIARGEWKPDRRPARPGRASSTPRNRGAASRG
jgi:hypothetical protein